MSGRILHAGSQDSGDAVRSNESAFLVPLFSPVQRAEYVLWTAIWIATLIFFWSWWLRPEHNIGGLRFALLTMMLVWVTLLPLYFIAIFFNSRAPARDRKPPNGLRVAMVVTKAPSEPFAVVAETLEAMLRQTYPHDTWLCDEDPSAETVAWCEARGIAISTRNGHADYHRQTWPRRTRCKEGNLAFFYDHYGYDKYDIVSQLDADHVPSETYLAEMLKPFSDPSVGYVSAPSICDKNAAQSWSARSRLYAEGTLHGALQAGYNAGWAPLCIGSHYAVRTKALREVGGLGPELAEDHSTTLMMNAHGWRGVHAIDAIANGHGPHTFADLATQEFQWSRSLVMILLQYSPIYLPMLPPRLKFQFLFSQLWYPLFSLFMAIMYAMPIVALIFDVNFVDVTYPEFLVHFVPISLVLMIMAFRWKAGGWCRPFNVKVLGWEGMLFLFARWPWSLAGTIVALYDRATRRVVDFRVTPKGNDPVGVLPFRVLMPYAALSLASALPALLLDTTAAARGFYVFASLNAALYALLLLVIVLRHATENGLLRRLAATPATVAQALLVLFVMAGPVAATSVHGATGLEAIAWGTDELGITTVTYPVAGASQDGSGVRRLIIPDWLFGKSR
jgi:cellulose synthase/poly-beta-1,6-N-acetylglucosamine synthase-like glycosyltransferase